ncbi:MAG: diguanylate cyclase, partial [Phormidesmis sp.]
FQLRGPVDWSSEVVVVGIDYTSLTEIGSFPWPRQYYTDLIARLTPAEPSVIAFDIIFADPSAADDALAAVFENQGRVILAQGWSAQSQAIVVTPVLAESVVTTGHIQKTEDSDGLTRWIEPSIRGISALGVAATSLYALVQAPVPGDFSGADRLWVNWPAPVQQAPHYSYVDVLEGAVPDEAFTGKIVLVGATATGLDHNLVTPFDRSPPANGVFLHAAVINNFLQQSFLRVPDGRWQILILILGGPVWGWAMGNFGRRSQLAFSLGIASSWAVTSLVMFHLNYWLPTVWPVCLVGLTVGGLVVARYLREKRQLQHQLVGLSALYDALQLGDRADLDRTTVNPNQQPSNSSALQVASYLTEVADQVSRLIWKDELTQISNRRAFDRGLSQTWQRALVTRSTVAVLMCDVDFFKQFNDTYGHPEGDNCLQQVASAIQATAARRGDLVARYGGEEFAVVLWEADAAGAIRVAHRICAAVSALKIPHVASQASDWVTLSIGIAVDIPQSDRLSQQLVDKADQALYRAKTLGRNRAVLFDEQLDVKAL